MGTEKRERQKANRAIRQQEADRAAARRRGLRIGLIAVGAIAAVFGLVWVASVVVDDGDDSATELTSPEGVASSDASGTDASGTDASGTGATGTAAAADSTPVETEAVAPADTADCPPPEGADTAQASFTAPPPMCLDSGVEYDAVIETNKGELTIALDAESAPQTVNNFVFLSRNRYYDDTTCHRIIPEFVVQCGDPTATGTGNPGYEIDDELPEEGEYQIGSVAMGNRGPDTNGSQFFIITGDQGTALQPNFSLFGQVVEGFDDTVLAMEAAGSPSGEPTEPVEILSVTIVER